MFVAIPQRTIGGRRPNSRRNKEEEIYGICQENIGDEEITRQELVNVNQESKLGRVREQDKIK